MLQEVERGHPRALVNGQKQGAGADLVAPVEVADSRQHPVDHSIMAGGNGLAVRPMMDATTRDIEQVAELFPRQAEPAADFHDGLGRGSGIRVQSGSQPTLVQTVPATVPGPFHTVRGRGLAGILPSPAGRGAEVEEPPCRRTDKRPSLTPNPSPKVRGALPLTSVKQPRRPHPAGRICALNSCSSAAIRSQDAEGGYVGPCSPLMPQAPDAPAGRRGSASQSPADRRRGFVPCGGAYAPPCGRLR